MKQGKFLPGILVIGAILIAIFAIYGFADVNNVKLDSPANGTWYNTRNVNFNCTAITNASDSLVNITLWMGLISNNALTYNQTNRTAATNATTINFTVQNIPDGAYYWTCQATNMSFGTPVRNMTNYTVYVDTLKPHTIALNSLENGLNTTSTTLNFNWTATDTTSSVMTCNLTIDSVINKTVNVINGTMANYSITGFADGIHYWNISSCNDSALNINITGSETRYFTVDANKPENIALNIANGTWKNSATVDFNWTATNTGTSPLYCNLTVDGTINKSIAVTSGVMANGTVAGLAEGLHSWYANCSNSMAVPNWNTTGALAATANTIWVDTVAPAITVSATPASVFQLASAVTIGCDATDATDASVSSASFTVLKPNAAYSQDLDGTFTDTSLIGDYTVTCSATDSASNTASSTAQFTVSSGTVSGGSSGSSGGSSSALTAIVSTTLASIAPGTPGVVTVSNSNVAVNEVQLTVSEAVSNVKVSVEALNAVPTGTVAAEGEIYKYVQITKTNLDDAKLTSAKISFFVTKAWLTEKGLDSSAVELKRYTTQWVSLPTIVKSSDATKVYFEATTPGFSVFAIGVKEEAPVEEAPVEEAPAEEAPVEEAPAEEAPVEPVAEKSNIWMFVLLGLVVVGVIVALVVIKKKKK